MKGVNLIKCMDNVEGMRQFVADESVNLVVTSPPYNVGDEKHNPMKYETYDDVKSTDDYLDWMLHVFGEVYRCMTWDGRVVINIGAKKNGRVPLNFFLTEVMYEVGFRLYSQIIWDKGHTSRNSAFGSWLKPSAPSFITTHEYILVFYKGSRKLVPKYHTTTDTDLTKEEFVRWARAKWEFPGVKNKELPAAFPLELPRRCIKMLSYKGDQVMDPFCGVGTTLIAAGELQRYAIGFDIDAMYVSCAVRDFEKGRTFNEDQRKQYQGSAEGSAAESGSKGSHSELSA